MSQEVNVSVKLQTQQAIQNLNELNKSFEASEDRVNDLTRELNKYNAELENTTGLTGQEMQKRSVLNERIKETKQKLTQEKQSLKELTIARRRENKTIQANTKESKKNLGLIKIVDKQTGGLIGKFTGFQTAVGSATKGMSALNMVLRASVFGAVALAIGAITSAFTKSEEGQNKFLRFFTQIKTVIGNVTDVLSDFGMALINVFSGNFQEAKKSLDAAVDGIKNFGEETRKEIKTAGELADKRAEIDKRERQLIIERAEATRKANELLVKSRDRENVSVEERIAALQEAGKIEDDIAAKEIIQAKARLEAKQTEMSLSKSTKADLDEEAKLKAKVIELEAQRLQKQKSITTQLSRARKEARLEEERDEKEAQDKKDEADAEQIRKDQELAQLKKDIRDAEATTEDEQRALELIKIDEHYQKLIDLAALNGLDTQGLIDAQNEAKLLKQQDFDAKDKARAEKAAKDKKKIQMSELEAEAKIDQAKLGLAKQFGNLLGQLAGKNKTAAIAGVLIEKAASIGQIISQTGIANAKAVAASPLTAGQPFVAINSVSAGLSVASSIASAQKAIQQIRSAGPGTAQGVGSVGGGEAIPVAQTSAPAFNIVGSAPENQLATTLAAQTQKPIQTFVVAGDVTTAQGLERNIVQESALG